jgi:hypothetical protein
MKDIGFLSGSALDAAQNLHAQSLELTSTATPLVLPCLSEAGMTYESFKSRIAGALTDSTQTWPLVPALVFRAMRCSTNDKAALAAFKHATASIYDASIGLVPAGISYLVEYNGNWGELWTGSAKDIPCGVLQGRGEDALFSNTRLFDQLCRLRDEAKGVIAAYPTSPHYRKFAALGNHTRLLILASTHDSAIPMSTARHTAAVYEQTVPPGRVQLVTFNGMVHTPLASDPGCGWGIVLGYIASPDWTLNLTCLADGHLPPKTDFAGDSAPTQSASLMLLGTKDLWGDVVPTPAPTL